MLKRDEQIQIHTCLEAGYSIPEIARRMGRSTATIYKYRKSYDDKGIFQKTITNAPIPEKLKAYTDYLDLKIKNGVINSSKLYHELVSKGYKGSYYHVNAYLKTSPANVGKPYKPSKHVETAPGEQAQVDWGSFGRVHINGKVEKLYAFVYVLSYSRAMYLEFVVRQNQKTFQDCHINAFAQLGIPKTIAYDNVKTVVLYREKTVAGVKPYYNSRFIDFARYYGFDPFLCPIYWPRSKGKVESGVKYVRNNFMKGWVARKNFTSLDDLNTQATRWTEKVANKRIHGSTKDKPYDRWLLEKSFLNFAKEVPKYETSMFLERHSTKDGTVQYKSCFYSVPREFVLKKLYIRDISKHGLPIVEIYYQDRIVATHHMSYERGKWVTNDEHLDVPQKSGRVMKKGKKSKLTHKYRRPHVHVAVRDLTYYNFLLPKKHGTKKS